jgi:uncharacterized membrane protein (TIGR02234 family)
VADARRTFGLTALVGLAAAGAAALVGNRDWVRVDDDGSGDATFATAVASGDLSAPPVTGTALVLLAAWGVLLVTRGRVRRAVAWLALVAALTVVGFAVQAWIALPDDVVEDLSNLDLEVTRSVWSYVGVLAGVVALVASASAVRSVGSWPEMGRRYDAPAGGAASGTRAATPAEEQGSLELWKALDEGRDPTDGAEPTDP